MTSYADLHPIAAEVTTVRPDWSIGAVLSVLASEKDRGTTDQLATAAMRAANDPATQAPVSITWAKFWAPRRATTSWVPANPLPECRFCAAPVKRNAQPVLCGGCGRRWEPRVFCIDRDKERLEARPCPPAVRAQMRGLWR